ncbi:RTC4-like domain-containing protein [Dichotomopilus funicola]|uniref:Restriction of telomere capping protein 4 n=1 Tax=Dichotomopilus funicola TaxID=1934379 RepID=A0AAN6ZQD1_9PEZI|nr:RTC4-like domain-containing protein [Dichotomopilus funicola]
MSRILGLSRNACVEPLHSNIKSSSTAKPKEVDIDAPPMSSSDSEDGAGLSSRGDIRPSRFDPVPRDSRVRKQDKDTSANVKTTRFGERSKRRREPTRPAAKSENSEPNLRAKRQARKSETVDSDDPTDPPISKKSKQSRLPDSSVGSQFEEELLKRRKAAASQTYGHSKHSLRLPKQATSSTKSSKPSVKTAITEPESPSSPREYKLAQLPPLPEPNLKDASSRLTSPARSSRVPNKKLKQPRKGELILSADERDFKMPVFKMPPPIPDETSPTVDDTADFARSPTPSAHSPPISLHSTPSPSPGPGLAANPPCCPLCSTEVVQADLDAFTKLHPRMSFANMRRFCEQHKLRSARRTWAEKGYPEIDWPGLDQRIEQHHDFLRGILEGETPSYYSDLFQEAVRSGQNRTLLRSDVNLTPGYYGMRGLNHMTENLIHKLAPVLRRRAVEERLVSARGHMTYLQTVLVAELAVRLIMEDMGVGERKARDILKESVEIGELVNDEIPDVVTHSDDESS